MKSGSFNHLEPYGTVQAFTGIALPLPLQTVREWYTQRSVLHNLFIHVFKEATRFGFHKAILGQFIDF
jgi:hypothetical protein